MRHETQTQKLICFSFAKEYGLNEASAHHKNNDDPGAFLMSENQMTI